MQNDTPDWLLKAMEIPIDRFITPPVLVAASESVGRTTDMLKSSPSHTVIVTRDDSLHLVGIITSMDLMKLRNSPKTALDIATTSDTIAIREDAQLWQLLKMINGDNSQKRYLDVVPVVDTEGRVRGVIERENLKRTLDQFNTK